MMLEKKKGSGESAFTYPRETYLDHSQPENHEPNNHDLHGLVNTLNFIDSFVNRSVF
jgi:hypothetical protein